MEEGVDKIELLRAKPVEGHRVQFKMSKISREQHFGFEFEGKGLQMPIKLIWGPSVPTVWSPNQDAPLSSQG